MPRPLLVATLFVVLTGQSCIGLPDADAGPVGLADGGASSVDASDAGPDGGPNAGYDPRVAPVCVVRVVSVNESPYAGAEIHPNDDVQVTAAQSVPMGEASIIDHCQWEIVDQPMGSVVSLTQPGGCTTGFVFGGGTLGVDLAGTYRLRVTVFDDIGASSNCELSFDVTDT